MSSLSHISAEMANQPVLRQVLQLVAERGAVRRNELTARDSALAPEQLDQAIIKLKNERLVEEATAPITDFNTVYITADGLRANRQLPPVR